MSVVIPAYNESHRLPKSLPVLSDALRRYSPDAEVIVVDDGSKDETARVAAELLRDTPNGRVISLPENGGKGAAVRAGVGAAIGEAIVFMDADLASDLADLPNLLSALEHAEVALGSRRLGGDADRDFTRQLGSWAFKWLIRLVVPLGIADTQCGFKAFRHTEAKLLFDQTRVTGFAFDVEVLALAKSLGYRIAEVPVRWQEQPDGTFNTLQHTPAMIAELLRTRRYVRRANRSLAARAGQPATDRQAAPARHPAHAARAARAPRHRVLAGVGAEPHSPAADQAELALAGTSPGETTRPLRIRQSALPARASRPGVPVPQPEFTAGTPRERGQTALFTASTGPFPDLAAPGRGRRGRRARRDAPSVPDGPARPDEAADPGTGDDPAAAARTSRWHLLWTAVAYAALFMAQAPGRLTADTKLSVAVDPKGFLAAATHLWDSSADFGAIPNQIAGYLFPMGPFFLAGRLLGLPPWLTQRLWMALLLTVATWGGIRLADTLRIGRPTSRVLGGLGYALSPMFLGKIGATSVAMTGAAMLPWIVLPLVLALRPDGAGGDDTGLAGPVCAPDGAGGERPDALRRGRRAARAAPPVSAATRLAPRRAAALSGLAVLCTGGINASVTADVLVCPAVLLLFAGGSRRVWALRAWWFVAVVLATAWWAIGLLALGRYGLNFLPFTESAELTTSTVSIAETLRTATDWMAYLRVPNVWLPAAAAYVGARFVIAGSYALAAVSLWGLARRDLPARRFLLITFGVGTVAVAAAYPGALGSPVSADLRMLLDGQLSPIRNVFKFQAVTHLPMALGLVHALGVATDRLADRSTGRRPATARGRRHPRRPVAGTAVVLTVVSLVASMLPLLEGKSLQPGSFGAVPGYWTRAANWLSANPQNGRTLLLPGSAFAEYDWGRPLDEPVKWLSSTPWGERSLIPLGGVGMTRWLDGIENALYDDGAGLGAALARAGVGQVLVRNDLADDNWDIPPSTDEIHRSLVAGGLRLGATFGPLVDARAGDRERILPAPTRRDAGRAPALEVWTVPGGAHAVDTYPVANAMVVSGGPEATVQLAEHGLLAPDRATVLAMDLGDQRTVDRQDADPATRGTVAAAADLVPAADILTPTTSLAVTDTFDRRDATFGLVHNTSSYLLGPTERPAGATEPVKQWTDRPPAGHQTVGGYLDGKSVTASSYGYLLRAAPEAGPAGAVDGLPYSWWSAQPDPVTRTEGAWLRVDVGTAVTVPYLTVQLLADTPRRPVATVLRVTTPNGSVDTPVSATEGPQRLAVPVGVSSRFTVTLLHVTGGDPRALGAGIRELAVPGQSFHHYAQVPTDATMMFSGQASGPVMYAFDRARADPTQPFNASEELTITRRFDTPRSEAFTVAGTAIAVPPPAGTPAPADAAAPAVLDCGRGPGVVIDGTVYSTRVEGRAGDRATAAPMRMTLCTPDGTVPLAAGQHVLSVLPGTAALLVDTISLASPATPATATATATATQPAGAQPAIARPATVGQWTPERRTVTLGAGQQTFLAVHENANRSWTASLDGTPLTPVRLDGWQQGWIVPAGGGDTVVIENNPGRSYRSGLAIGLGLVLLLVVIALLPAGLRLRPSSDPHAHPRFPDPRRLRLTRAASRLPGPWVAAAAATLAVWLVAGPAALALPPLAFAARRRPAALPWIAASGMTAAGVIMVLNPNLAPRTGQGAFSGPAQAAGALAFAATVAALCAARGRPPATVGGGPQATAGRTSQAGSTRPREDDQ
ncbi:alpha-(1-_3)-arabinofuranosyltransferase family protein [Frankia sp. AgB32]|uniref:alpha-(1->3)-arabinofuranosyltransferase domain-containing protein n=1 Tax=Frankia sp. AgB32 TaxID=631119 RepID=UPI00200E54B5|nr:alpha-(1->3)-arabinofuranosyltransferase family protein [Frankia sp. AgB32]MCK9897329.1 alpha-(1->3)-arabinofuranosyltransferase family protein [Frankia sp. AgB32]